MSCLFITLLLLWTDVLLDEVELLDILGATGEICRMFSPAVGTFWGGAWRFWAIFRSMLLVAFDALRGPAAES
jgi:hypothetical protein